jgi:hypothetical protein
LTNDDVNEAAVLRYVDCGKHLGEFLQSDGSRRFDLREKSATEAQLEMEM